MLDVLITGGEVVDGNGGARRRADVAIENGRVVGIGQIEAEAAQTVDATGKIVSPGFIDVHTHIDAQAFWDTTLSPSPLHGVTTAIAGNCGFTIAPLGGDASNGDYLMRMLSRVEGMPLESLQAGIPWGTWESTGEYLDALDGTLSINTGFMVGHSALRRVVMGPESTERECTPDELEAMSDLFRAGLDAGGLGLSSTWSRTHNDADGNMVPSRHASREEVIELCRVQGDYAGTALEFIPSVGPNFEQWAVDLMADMSVAAKTPLNWNVLNVTARTLDQAFEKLKASDVAAERGGKVVALTVPMTLVLRMNFISGFILDAIPGWEGPMLSSLEDKLELFSDRTRRNELNALAQAPDSPMRSLANWQTKHVFEVFAPENEKYLGRTIGEIATDEGRDAWDVLCDMAVADELRTSFGVPPTPEPHADWEARAEIWRDDRAIIGASDAGAHLDLFGSFNYSTYTLANAVRGAGVMSLEEAIMRMTSVQADLYGMVDRGRLVEGAHADVIVFDEATIDTTEMTTVYDLPTGAGRLYAEGVGIDHVFCNGTEIVRDGAFTDARPGTMLRRGTHTK